MIAKNNQHRWTITRVLLSHYHPETADSTRKWVAWREFLDKWADHAKSNNVGITTYYGSVIVDMEIAQDE